MILPAVARGRPGTRRRLSCRWAGAFAVLAVVSGQPDAARAVEPTTPLAVGGPRFVRNDVLELLAEDLSVSPQEVRVVYRVRNKTTTPVRYQLAVPLPPIDASMPEAFNVELPAADEENFIDLRLTVDGRPVTPLVFQRAAALGVDRTAEITALGLPLNPRAPGVLQRLKDLSADKRADVNRLGLASVEGDSVEAAWRYEVTLHWEQTFPAGREVTIEQRYRPVIGTGSFDLTMLEDRQYRTRYCMDDAFLRTARSRLSTIRRSGHPHLEEIRLTHLLSTGRSWSGPTKSFRLLIDKGEADALVSLCLKGVRRISSTHLEMTANDFVPERDLDILIVRRHREQ